MNIEGKHYGVNPPLPLQGGDSYIGFPSWEGQGWVSPLGRGRGGFPLGRGMSARRIPKGSEEDGAGFPLQGGAGVG